MLTTGAVHLTPTPLLTDHPPNPTVNHPKHADQTYLTLLNISSLPFIVHKNLFVYSYAAMVYFVLRAEK